jgi:DNA-binding NtrC family response regulator
VRVIAATNKDLDRAMNEKAFREDLFYRLNVFPIHLAPLRQRREDIVPLSDYLARKIAARMGRHALVLGPEARKILYHYDWPGNVRELENSLERALIVAKGDTLLPQDLLIQPENPVGEMRPPTLAELERTAVLEALERNQGDRRITARELGVSLRTLQYRLKDYGIAGKD